jgi:hypothetical protein
MSATLDDLLKELKRIRVVLEDKRGPEGEKLSFAESEKLDADKS